MASSRYVPVFLCIALAPVVATGQPAGVRLEVGTRTLELGEAIRVKVVCTNTGRPAAPVAVVPEGLDLKLLNPTPSTSSFTQIINGRTTQRTTYTFVLQLTALKEGTYVLGPISVDADGRTYQTQTARIEVSNTEVASVPDGDRIAFARIDVEPDSLYVTETYTATLRFGIRKVEINGQRYPLDMLRDVLDLRASQLSVFGGGNAQRSERWLPDSTGARHQYELFTVTRQIRAEQVGEVQVGPVFLRVHYPLAIRRGFFGGYEITRRQRESARAESVSVTVKAPPAEGRPPDYTGAIGRFTLDVSARPTRVQQGQPITLSVSIRGTPLEGVAGPSLTGNPELASRFDYAGDELVGDIERGAKVFRRAVFPKQSGEQTIPPITWSYFDPGSERYVTLSSPPIPIVVDPPAESASVAATVESEPHGAGRETTLTVLSGGLSPNVTDPRRALATQSVVVSNAWIAGLFLWPAAWLTMTLVMRHRGRLKDDVDFARRRGARRTALRRIQQTLRSNGTVDSRLHQLGRALTGYLADRTCRGAATVTPDEVRSLLTRNGLNESSVDRIVGFLEMCDAAHYTPGGVAPDAPAAVARRIKRWIRDIERSGL